MLSRICFAILFIFSSLSHAKQDPMDGWALGVGFGLKSDVNQLVGLDLKAPALWGEEGRYTFVFSVSSGATTIDDSSGSSTGILPVRLMFESRLLNYRDVVSGYSRIGAGYFFVDKYLQPDGGFFTIPVQFGVDLIVADRANGVKTTMFAQVGIDFGFDLNDDDPGRYLDGTEIMIGVRTFY